MDYVSYQIVKGVAIFSVESMSGCLIDVLPLDVIAWVLN